MKNIMYRIIILAIAICISAPSISQSIRKKGFIVVNKGDTIHGWINYRNWEKNPNSISLSQDSSSGSMVNYSKHDLQAVEITGFDNYIKVIVVKDARPITIGSLLPPEIDSLISDTVLLRILVKGSEFSLYELIDNKPHFFIQKTGENIRELNYRLEQTETNHYVTKKNYINQLRAYLANTSASIELLRKIEFANYNERDLSKIIYAMNKISGDVEYISLVKSKKLLVSFFAGVGGGYSKLKHNGAAGSLSKMKLSGGFVPFATAGIDISSTRNLQSIVFRGEFSFMMASYTGKGETPPPLGSTEPYYTSYNCSQINISPTISLLYNFIRNESVRVYAGAGVAFNFTSYSKNEYKQTNSTYGEKTVSNYLEFPKVWVSPVFKLGTKLNNRLSIEMDVRVLSSMTNYAFWSLTPQTCMAQIRYHF